MPLWCAEEPLVLASQSAVRRTILESAGVAVEVSAADIDERGIEARSGLSDPGEIASLLAREKARAVSAAKPARFVLGADQTLALEAQRFSKPDGRAQARAQLMTLRGRTHALHSGVAVLRDGKPVFEHRAVARLAMRAFSEAFLDAYLDAAGDAVTRSVGAYQVEGLGLQLFEHIEGDHFTILGLPLLPLLDHLRRQGLLAA